ncbi:MAG: TM2 domain-containing protein [Chloroflexi bacterium]|nr:TM2 domain-containing protein [Chloroflexota bacterium]
MERIPRLTVHDLTERELLVLRDETAMRKKSHIAVWLLWVFLGVFGAHRFYLGRIGTGITPKIPVLALLGMGLGSGSRYSRDFRDGGQNGGRQTVG